jgi:AraC-like DNA-binding protein
MSTNLQYRPAAPLGHFVGTIWYYEGYTQPHAMERLLPDGSMGLIVNLDEDRIRIYDREDPTCFTNRSGVIAMGAQPEFFVIDTAQQRCVLGVHFRPGGAFPFLDMPADALQGEHVDVKGSLRERILEAPTPRERCLVMEAELLARAFGRLELRPEIVFAVRELERQCTVAEVLSQTGFTAKRFTEQFRKAVGLTPKVFSRVRRFQSALRTIANDSKPDWTGIALSCGYFDQAHFNHDFRAFSGINPSTYSAKKTPHLNHVPL